MATTIVPRVVDENGYVLLPIVYPPRNSLRAGLCGRFTNEDKIKVCAKKCIQTAVDPRWHFKGISTNGYEMYTVDTQGSYYLITRDVYPDGKAIVFYGVFSYDLYNGVDDFQERWR
jgi:hypothetical protein